MKTILQPDAGQWGVTVKRRTERLRRLSLGASLLRPSLWTPIRSASSLSRTAASGSTAPMMISVPPSARRDAPMLRAAGTVQRVSGRTSMLAVRPPGAAPKLSPREQSPPRVASASSGGAPTRPAASRPMMTLQHASRRATSVVGPVAPGAATRMPSLRSIAGASARPRSSPRDGASRPAPAPAARSRVMPSAAQSGQRNRPASALAAHMHRSSGQRLSSASSSPTSRTPSASSSSPQPADSEGRDRSGGNGGSDVDASSGNGNGNGGVTLSGDFVVDGRRLGELALNSAARGGSSAQTGARNPNFRRTALPSGMSAPLP